MYWNFVARFYDLFENLTNRKVYNSLAFFVASKIRKEDVVLECACGTGVITQLIADRCNRIIATDFSQEMLNITKKKCAEYSNVSVEYADICNLPYRDKTFDKVIAANVIHLLDNPYIAVKQLDRVCKSGGQIIIPTYINKNDNKPSLMSKILDRSGANFKRQFDYEEYQKFFKDLGYEDIEFELIKGNMPCAIALISKK